MSSDGSVSSGISQFGLYRSIDARTEEFLKLSKKRQIKQGCVCAAISTALTVIVVVAVLLIYEYNVIAEARRRDYNGNWLDLMNSSVDDTILAERFNKDKIEVDRTTLKLLPILLKALEQNRYINKVVEEPSVIYPPREIEITTESGLIRNIFADTRNWMKTPRLYAIEYKTSPIVYFKNPTRNTDYFTKIRKIRDYKRILNYVDKMISDKNSLDTTQPMKKDIVYTEKPFKLTSPIPRHKITQKALRDKLREKLRTEEKTKNCKCFHKLSDMMNNILNSTQQILARLSRSNLKEIVQPSNQKVISPFQRRPVKTLENNSKRHSTKRYKIKTEVTENFKSKPTDIDSYNDFLNRHQYIMDVTPTKSLNTQRDRSIKTTMNLIKPKLNNIDKGLKSEERFSTTNSYMQLFDTTNILKESSSNLYRNGMDQNKNNRYSDVVTTSSDYIFRDGTDVTTDIRSSLASVSETDFTDDDYVQVTEATTNSANNFKKLDSVSLGLVKSNLIRKMNEEYTTKVELFKGVSRNQEPYNNIALMRKVGNQVSKDKNKSIFLSKLHRLAPISNQIPKPIQTTQTTSETIKSCNYKTNTLKPMKKNITLKNITKAVNMQKKQSHKNEIMSQKQTLKIKYKGNSTNTTLQDQEEEIVEFNNETTQTLTQDYNGISDDTYQWKTVTLEESTTPSNFMMPPRRSTYLEMQRNDWKQYDNQDFDDEITHYFFD